MVFNNKACTKLVKIQGPWFRSDDAREGYINYIEREGALPYSLKTLFLGTQQTKAKNSGLFWNDEFWCLGRTIAGKLSVLIIRISKSYQNVDSHCFWNMVPGLL